MKIGLTGSIACGKSTVSQYLKQKGCLIVDADAISRTLTADGGAALPEIRQAFGDDVFSGASLDRAKLGQLVFADAQKREALNAILHPMILAEIKRQLDQLDAPGQIVIGDIPLLYECGMEALFDTVWVVRADRETQIQRLFERDGLSREQAERRIDSQMPLDEKIRRADAVIDTSGTLEQTRQQVDALLFALKPARRRRPPQTLDLSDDVPPERPSVPRRAVRVVPIETEDSPRHTHSARKGSPFDGLPAPVRFLALALALILLVTGAVSITKTYLAKQEERRRLEAEAAERAQHPLYYGDLITLYASEQNLDPALVSAVILCESSFDPKAESRLGARGLMQLMPDTAEWVAHKYNEDGAGYSFDNLYDPETNIRYGTWYLGYLSRRFGGDATKIVCAYHAGQGNVDSWLKNPQYSADGVTLDVIPTQDTATYASRVLRARDVYRKYYFPVEPPEPTES